MSEYFLQKNEEGFFLVLPEAFNEEHNVTSFSSLEGSLIMSPEVV
jgi:hypothetical protein